MNKRPDNDAEPVEVNVVWFLCWLIAVLMIAATCYGFVRIIIVVLQINGYGD